MWGKYKIIRKCFNIEVPKAPHNVIFMLAHPYFDHADKRQALHSDSFVYFIYGEKIHRGLGKYS